MLLYFDLGSPYAYLACSRAANILGATPELEPVLLGAIFRMRGHGSWASTAEREARMSEVEQRARRYGLPSLRWPADWPGDGLAAMRAATWAKREGRLPAFVRAAFHAEFAQGASIADMGVLAACAQEAGLEAAALERAIASPDIKDELRRATEAAWAIGVRGIPTLRVAERLYYGDDRLEIAPKAGD